MRFLGTLINVGAVVVGSLIGLFFHSRLPKRLTTVAFQGIGLFTLFIGFTMAAKTKSLLVLVFSIVLGAISGELLDIDRLLNRFGEWLRNRLERKREWRVESRESIPEPSPATPDSPLPTPGHSRFAEGLVTAFLLFCMGSMTVLGAIEEGLGGRPNLLAAKSVLDGFASLALAASLGIGVLFSVIPLLIYQGGLTLLAGSLPAVISDIVVNEVSAAGGLILIGLGITILEIKQLKVLNMLPALVFAGVLAAVFLRS
ncbi:DUF554 domain-containing protein [candidate division WOR-3 bacterium]|uniref:DUF554 domain-containing protein n=1 Tax=candidate division WOR-3 bacterium TaxID=2052148 RepID=A0A937XHR0_UNCW3|nr:DUF554 domain-containing protein [candidate division WOR-3 bacterium]